MYIFRFIKCTPRNRTKRIFDIAHPTIKKQLAQQKNSLTVLYRASYLSL